MVEPIQPEKWMNDIDWSAIAAKLPGDTRTEVTAGSLQTRSFWIFKAAVGVSNDSIRGKAKSLLNAQIRRWEASWLQEIKFYADQQGISFEDAFVDLATKD